MRGMWIGKVFLFLLHEYFFLTPHFPLHAIHFLPPFLNTISPK